MLKLIRILTDICKRKNPFGAILIHFYFVQVRGMPCAHNFHVECIDEWLRLNVKCPRCRSSVFPNLDLSALSNLHSDTEQTSDNAFVTTQPSSLPRSTPTRAAHTENTTDLYTDTALEAVENGNSPLPSASPHWSTAILWTILTKTPQKSTKLSPLFNTDINQKTEHWHL